MIKNNKGSALILVLFIVTIGILIGGSLLIYADSANNDTISYHRSEQAYFTARSAVAATIKYIQANYKNQTVMNDIMSNQGVGYSSDLGTYTVNVAYTKTNEIKISATATYKNKKSTVDAYLTKPDKAPSVIPTDYLFFVDGSVENSFCPNIVNGSVYVNGDLNVASDSKINKNVIAHGNVDISGAGATMDGLICFGNANIGEGGSVDGDAWVQRDLKLSGSSPINGNVQCFGNVTLEAGGKINGNTLLKGDLTCNGGTKIVGDVQGDGNLIMTEGSSIQGNATIGKNVVISGGNPKITDGMLYYMGTLNYSEGTLSQFIPSGAEKISSYDPVDLDSYNYTCDALPIIKTPSLSNHVTLNNKTINNSGILTSDIFSSLSYGSTVTIDTSHDNICLIIDNTDFDPAYGINFEVTGPNNLYIYMTGNSSFTIESNQYMGMKNPGDTPKIFIFGDGSQTVTVTNNSEMDANIYVPNGCFSAGGSMLKTYKFQGSCITKSIDIQSNVSLNYLPPDISGTPLEVLNGSQPGNNDNNWAVERWSDK